MKKKNQNIIVLIKGHTFHNILTSDASLNYIDGDLHTNQFCHTFYGEPNKNRLKFIQQPTSIYVEQQLFFYLQLNIAFYKQQTDFQQCIVILTDP